MIVEDTWKELVKAFKNATEALERFGSFVNKPKPKERGHHPGSKNHNKKASKTRRVMARESNRVNRQRIKKWKY